MWAIADIRKADGAGRYHFGMASLAGIALFSSPAPLCALSTSLSCTATVNAAAVDRFCHPLAATQCGQCFFALSMARCGRRCALRSLRLHVQWCIHRRMRSVCEGESHTSDERARERPRNSVLLLTTPWTWWRVLRDFSSHTCACVYVSDRPSQHERTATGVRENENISN